MRGGFCRMQVRFALTVLMLAVFAAPASAEPASSSESQATSKKEADGKSEKVRIVSEEPARKPPTAVEEAAKNITGIKDEARLPSEGDAPASIAEAAPPQPVKVEPRRVPELSRADFCSLLAESAQQQRIPVALFARLIWQESRFDPNSVSRAGAQGVAQFMPSVAAEVGLRNPFNPLEAVPAAARFLR